MVHFLGVLEQKGLDAISEYSRLIAEVIFTQVIQKKPNYHVIIREQQLKLEKGDMPGLT